MSAVDHELTIVVRSGMPANLLDLLRKFPRDQWAGEPSIKLAPKDAVTP